METFVFGVAAGIFAVLFYKALESGNCFFNATWMSFILWYWILRMLEIIH